MLVTLSLSPSITESRRVRALFRGPKERQAGGGGREASREEDSRTQKLILVRKGQDWDRGQREA